MIEVDVRVDAPAWQTALVELEGMTQAAVAAACTVGAIDTAQISILYTDDPQIRSLNQAFRNKDAPTDVLSFPAELRDRPFLGDIAISLGVARRDATAHSKQLDQHVAHLLIHGVLHLLGHDHIDDTDAEEMEALECSALASLGWPDPYS